MKGKKNMSKLLAMVLAFALIISSVCWGTAEQNEVKAAGTVSTDMLAVKAQIAVDGAQVIRFITSVDALDTYYKVGFEVVTPTGTKTWETQTVYERIVSNVTNKEYEFSPKVVDLTSEYFATAKFQAEVGVDYKVRAYVTTVDAPATKIYGPSRTVALSDANDNVINMMVDFETSAETTYDVYDGSTKIGTAKVIDNKNVRITLDSKKVSDFPSATKLTFKSGDTEVGTDVYRNYYTSYAEDGADMTWYTVDETATNFVIASSADLYGLAKVINDQLDTTVFENDTVTLIRNVVINEDMTNPSYEWDRIGNNQIGFAGTFDGDFNTISGILDVKAKTGGSNNQAHGFFGYVANTGTVRNFSLVNSKFEFINATDNAYQGNNAAICGYLQGVLENIYVGEDVTINTNVSAVGGLAGMVSVTSKTQATSEITNCWFAGTVTGTTGTIGGIVGNAYRGPLSMGNCLNTGTIVVTAAGCPGGIMGAASGNANEESGNTLNKNRTTIANCISAGTVLSANTANSGSVIGYFANTETTVTNVYTTDNIMCTKEGASFSTSNSADGYGTWNSNANVTIQGLPIVDEDGSILNGIGAYTNTEFDFWSDENEDGVWVAIEWKTPELKKFSEGEGIATLNTKRASEGWYYAAFERPGTANAAMSRADAATYELDSVADLNGFEKVANDTSNTELFLNDTLKLTADIDLNPGWVPQVNSSGVLTNIPKFDWNPIGKQAYEMATNFEGTFDGQGHTISGVYVLATTRDAGLFGITLDDAKILNLRMSNSYINANEKNWCGAVAGTFRGKLMENVYVDESVTVKAAHDAGGIVGMMSLGRVRTISKCWFGGTVYASGTQIGGILGWSQNGTNTMENCLYTGKIVSTYTGDAKVAALVGDASGGTNTYITDCLALGEVQVKSATNTNAVVGKTDASKVVITDVYTTNNITNTANASTAFETRAGVTVVTIDAIKENPTTTLAGLLKNADDTDNTAWIFTTGKEPELKWK